MAREDLIPLNKRSTEERRKIARAGKLASDAAKKRKKQTRDLIRELLSAAPQLTSKQVRQLQKAGVSAEDVTIEALSLIAIANHAMAGDLAAAKFLYDYAQVPDIKVQLERERIELAKQAQATAKDSADKVTVILDV